MFRWDYQLAMGIGMFGLFWYFSNLGMPSENIMLTLIKGVGVYFIVRLIGEFIRFQVNERIFLDYFAMIGIVLIVVPEVISSNLVVYYLAAGVISIRKKRPPWGMAECGSCWRYKASPRYGNTKDMLAHEDFGDEKLEKKYKYLCKPCYDKKVDKNVAVANKL